MPLRLGQGLVQGHEPAAGRIHRARAGQHPLPVLDPHAAGRAVLSGLGEHRFLGQAGLKGQSRERAHNPAVLDLPTQGRVQGPCLPDLAHRPQGRFKGAALDLVQVFALFFRGRIQRLGAEVVTAAVREPAGIRRGQPAFIKNQMGAQTHASAAGNAKTRIDYLFLDTPQTVRRGGRGWLCLGHGVFL